MKNDVKDVFYCRQGHHMMPAGEKTRMLSDDGKGWRTVCNNCKDKTYTRRANAYRQQAK